MEEIRTRTTLLRVLLTLSMVGGFWSMINGLTNAFSDPSLEGQEVVNQLLENFEDLEDENLYLKDDLIEFSDNMQRNRMNYGVFEFMFNAISLIGVFLMWQFRRIGFWVYLTAQVLMLMNPILFGGYSILTVSATLFYAFLSLVFISLYSTQLKYLNA